MLSEMNAAPSCLAGEVYCFTRTTSLHNYMYNTLFDITYIYKGAAVKYLHTTQSTKCAGLGWQTLGWSWVVRHGADRLAWRLASSLVHDGVGYRRSISRGTRFSQVEWPIHPVVSQRHITYLISSCAHFAPTKHYIYFFTDIFTQSY